MNEQKKKIKQLRLTLDLKLAGLDQQSKTNPGKLFRIHAIMLLAGSFVSGFAVARFEETGRGHLGNLKMLSRLLLLGQPG